MVGSIYNLDYAIKYRDLYQNAFTADKWLKQLGSKDKPINLVFTQPPQPFKCGGAPQKVMHLISADLVKSGGIRQLGFDVNMYFAAPRIFGVPY